MFEGDAGKYPLSGIRLRCNSLDSAAAFEERNASYSPLKRDIDTPFLQPMFFAGIYSFRETIVLRVVT